MHRKRDLGDHIILRACSFVFSSSCYYCSFLTFLLAKGPLRWNCWQYICKVIGPIKTTTSCLQSVIFLTVFNS